jgi:hypothetical protein
MTPLIPREELITTYLECLGMEMIERWPETDTIVCHDPVTGSQFGAELSEDLETIQDNLRDARARFGK